MLLCCAETMTIMPQLDVRSIGIQCNLLAVPPLKKLQCKDDITEESLPSEAEETDLNTFHFSQEETIYKFINTYKHLILIDLILINNTVMTLSSHHPHFMLDQTVDEISYIAIRSLLEFFTHSPLCHNTCTGEVAYVQGTFIAVKQCSHCEHQRQWTSQPNIRHSCWKTFYCQQLYCLVELLQGRF